MKNRSKVFFGFLLTIVTMFIISVAAYADDTEAELPDNGIPVVIIEIDETENHTIEDMNSSPDHSVECYGNIQIVVPDGFTCPDLDVTPESLGPLKLDYIRGRGNATWAGQKKPYKIKLKKKYGCSGNGIEQTLGAHRKCL